MSAEAFASDLMDQAHRLRAHARRLGADQSSIDDLVQGTIVKAWIARDSFAAGTSLAAWLRVILRNLLIDDHRRAAPLVEFTDEVTAPEVAAGGGALPGSRLGWLSDQGLTRRQHDALVDVAILGYSLDEAAQRQGVSLHAIKSRLSSARTKVRKLSGVEPPPRCFGAQGAQRPPRHSEAKAG